MKWRTISILLRSAVISESVTRRKVLFVQASHDRREVITRSHGRGNAGSQLSYPCSFNSGGESSRVDERNERPAPGEHARAALSAGGGIRYAGQVCHERREASKEVPVRCPHEMILSTHTSTLATQTGPCGQQTRADFLGSRSRSKDMQRP